MHLLCLIVLSPEYNSKAVNVFQANRRSGIAEEAARLALSQLNRSSASPAPKKGGSKEPDRKDTKKGVSGVSSHSFVARQIKSGPRC